MTAQSALDIIVLTGFLGSGKTTLIRDFLSSREASDTAVIVNEVGEIGLDGAILRADESGGGVPMAMLANGCICCEAGNDLLYTVAGLLEGRPGLRRIIVETSGVSRPGPVLRQLAGIGGRLGRVAVVATYDPLCAPVASAFEEAAAQWAAAHRIVVTKTERLPPSRLAEVGTEVRAINPLSEIVIDTDREAAVRLAFTPTQGVAALPDVLAPAEPSGIWPRLCVCVARPERPLCYQELAEWLDNLAAGLGERLLRVKGIVSVSECEVPLLIQSVGTLFSAPAPIGNLDDDHPCGLVIIARDLTDGELETLVTPPVLRIVPREQPLHRPAA